MPPGVRATPSSRSRGEVRGCSTDGLLGGVRLLGKRVEAFLDPALKNFGFSGVPRPAGPLDVASGLGRGGGRAFSGEGRGRGFSGEGRGEGRAEMGRSGDERTPAAQVWGGQTKNGRWQLR
eukprot:CAMPEP_0114564316 /NCGR_PEP_ID=MMETSP0114-20121206/13648_1 /TAXON_ID=31324 /ORGANISM="Goniomonas sp, Strain m" /LENGTH=120 /DNA_ID=CAMNT_0001750361 /DNA_START=198 /DNA_END=560 /DNA_ORIENTATION=-